MKKEKLSNTEISKSFDAVAKKFDAISNPYTTSRRYKEINAYMKGKCLEVGAATGSFIPESQKNNYILSDISFGMCKAAKLKHKNVVCCDAESLPFANNIFDTVISSELIYYLENPGSFAKEANRVMKKGGKLIISSANHDMRIYDRIRKILRDVGMGRMYFDDPINSFMKMEGIEKLLARNKFKINITKKIVFLPFSLFHKSNLFFEKTFLKHLSMFIFVVAEKK